MKMIRTSANVWMFAALSLVVAACGNKNKDDDEESSAEPTTTTAKTSAPAETSKSGTSSSSGGATTTDTSTASNPPKGAIEAHVKAELDNRSDGATAGNKVVPTGAKALFTAPTELAAQPAKGDLSISQTADGKTIVAASGYDGDAKRDLAAASLGLTNCQWNPAESISVGKDKLAATAADGLCTKGSAQMHTAYFGDTAENLLVFGAWDAAGGDMKKVFDAMRSTQKAAAGDASGIAACCDALRQNAKSAPLQQQGFYMAAAGACDALRNNPQGRQALGQVRAALMGASMPAACK